MTKHTSDEPPENSLIHKRAKMATTKTHTSQLNKNNGSSTTHSNSSFESFTQLHHQQQSSSQSQTQPQSQPKPQPQSQPQTHTQQTPTLSSTQTHTNTHMSNNVTSHPSQYIIQQLYNEHDKGPDYTVIMEKENINEITIGQTLKKENFASIKEIKKTNKNRLKVTLTDKKEANKIITSPHFSRILAIKSFIPKSFIISVGLVKDVPTNLSIDELLDCCRVQGDIVINKMERLNFYDKINKCYKPSTSIKIEFRSSTLPTEMILFYVRKQIEHFIPKPTLCRKCLRYGHVDKICRSSVRACNNCCMEVDHVFSPSCMCMHCQRGCVALCKYCKCNEHNTFTALCPFMKKQYEIKKTMIIKNVEFNEAKILVEQHVDNKTKTYADVTSLTQKLNLMQKEINNVKQLNETLIKRITAAEQIFDKFMIAEKISETTSSSPSQPSINEAKSIQMCKQISEYSNLFRSRTSINIVNKDISEPSDSLVIIND